MKFESKMTIEEVFQGLEKIAIEHPDKEDVIKEAMMIIASYVDLSALLNKLKEKK